MSAPTRPGAMGEKRERREVVTPEGVPISFDLASVGDRAGALMIDLLIMTGVVFVVAQIAAWAFGGNFEKDSWLAPLIVILVFLIQNFYFVFFELRWQGWTPGKRALGIRVIDARGGPLEPSAIVARNLIRYLELWFPLQQLVAAPMLSHGTPPWQTVVSWGWLAVFVLLPLFNRDRLRAGDFVAGTRVVVQPKPQLLPDLAAPDEWKTRKGAAPPPPAYVFTEQQLGVYGEFELQVLEQALRGEPGAERHASLVAITNKIRVKLRYEGELREADVELFLNTYYTAVRAHLERRRLFGKRKADKYS